MEQKIRRDRNMGDNLRKLRLDHDISQEKLCAELRRRGCDIGRSTYAKYEAGELNIRASVIIELKKIYNCSYDDFFEGLDVIIWGDFMAIKSVSIRIEEEMLNKIGYVADYEGRSVNSHVLVLIRENIKKFEEEHGSIDGDINPDVNVKPTRK